MPDRGRAVGWLIRWLCAVVVLLGDFQHFDVSVGTEEGTAPEADRLEHAVPVHDRHMRWEIIPADGHETLELSRCGVTVSLTYTPVQPL